MATTTELGLLSLTHLHNLTQQQHQHHNNKNQNQNQNQDQDHYHHHQDQEYLLNPNHPSGSNTTISSGSTSWMWNPKGQQGQEAPAEEESWEVRAFAEDTGSVMGTTWPPRSYTCAFCRREFRSAQALGGHMNVHRRDRARLHQVIPHNSPLLSHPPPGPSPSSSAAGSAQLCLLYHHLPPGPARPAGPSTLLSMSMPPPPPYDGGGDGGGRRVVGRRDHHHQIRTEERTVEIADRGGEEVDLELRLGHGPTPS